MKKNNHNDNNRESTVGSDECCNMEEVIPDAFEKDTEDSNAHQEKEYTGEQETIPKEWLQKLKDAEIKRDEYLTMAQRVQADFDNFRRRNKNAVADAYKSSAADTVEIFLPVLDNLDRALLSAMEAGTQDSMVKGIEMVIRQFKDCLGKLEVEEIEAIRQPFDPELHNAVMQVEAQEGQQEGMVAEVLQKGYIMKDKVIRYSMVKVVK